MPTSDVARLASVHPRVCGERADDLAGDGTVGGSSPRVRGTRAADSRARRAIDGSSPRVRGTPLDRRAGIVHRGSSPRVRGTPVRLRGDVVQRSVAVHPRVCGERDAQERATADRSRFIPACAGNAMPAVRLMPSPRFIPACAGNALIGPEFAHQIGGSSPRVRGTRLRSGDLEMTVHPRVCGERRAAQGRLHSGSSPRVRGTLFPEETDPKILHDVKQRTGVLSMFQAPRQGAIFIGAPTCTAIDDRISKTLIVIDFLFEYGLMSRRRRRFWLRPEAH